MDLLFQLPMVIYYLFLATLCGTKFKNKALNSAYVVVELLSLTILAFATSPVARYYLPSLFMGNYWYLYYGLGLSAVRLLTLALLVTKRGVAYYAATINAILALFVFTNQIEYIKQGMIRIYDVSGYPLWQLLLSIAFVAMSARGNKAKRVALAAFIAGAFSAVANGSVFFGGGFNNFNGQIIGLLSIFPMLLAVATLKPELFTFAFGKADRRKTWGLVAVFVVLMAVIGAVVTGTVKSAFFGNAESSNLDNGVISTGEPAVETPDSGAAIPAVKFVADRSVNTLNSSRFNLFNDGLVAAMGGYPIFYDPDMGGLFWLNEDGVKCGFGFDGLMDIRYIDVAGDMIYFATFPDYEQGEIYSYNITTNELRSLTTATGNYLQECGGYLFYMQDTWTNPSIWRMTVDGDDKREIYSGGLFNKFVVDKEIKQLVCFRNGDGVPSDAQWIDLDGNFQITETGFFACQGYDVLDYTIAWLEAMTSYRVVARPDSGDRTTQASANGAINALNYYEGKFYYAKSDGIYVQDLSYTDNSGDGAKLMTATNVNKICIANGVLFTYTRGGDLLTLKLDGIRPGEDLDGNGMPDYLDRAHNAQYEDSDSAPSTAAATTAKGIVNGAVNPGTSYLDAYKYFLLLLGEGKNGEFDENNPSRDTNIYSSALNWGLTVDGEKINEYNDISQAEFDDLAARLGIDPTKVNTENIEKSQVSIAPTNTPTPTPTTMPVAVSTIAPIAAPTTAPQSTNPKEITIKGTIYSTDLTKLDLSFQTRGFVSSDIVELRYMTKLITLDLSDTEKSGIDDISPLSALKNLTWLQLTNHTFSDVTPLGELWNLSTIHMSGTNVSDLTPLSKLVNLTTLTMNSNKVVSVRPLSVLSKLTNLHLDRNAISDVEPLGRLTSLKTLGLRYNNIVDVESLKSLTNLETLQLDGNPLSVEQVDSLREALPNCTITF